MKIKAAVFDIDGTLVPHETHCPSRITAKTLRALSESGVSVIIATGRARLSAAAALGGRVQPDYFVTANGAEVTDRSERTVWSNRMTPEEMYVLVDFCEDYDLPLEFIFSDGYYAYVEYESFAQHFAGRPDMLPFCHDGEDQVRHMEDMPFGACAVMPEERAAEFNEKYGYLGLRLIRFAPGRYDVLRESTSKRAGVETVLKRLGVSWEETAAFGDAENDAELLDVAGLSVLMGDGDEALRDSVDIVTDSCIGDGAAKAVQKYLLDAQK